MRTSSQAEELARLLIRTGERSGLTTVAYIANMENPLGRSVGNWLEIRECIDCLQGANVPDLLELTYQLAGTMIHLSGKAASIDEGIEIAQNMVTSGTAWEKFCEIVTTQGGQLNVIQDPNRYPVSAQTIEIKANTTGWIHTIPAREIGLSVIELGGGRKRIEDKIDYKAGIVFHKTVGDHVNKNDALFTVHTDLNISAQEIAERILNNIKIRNQKCDPPVLIQNYLDKNSV
jgi:pyrimidine-nucleoside phosphorylase